MPRRRTVKQPPLTRVKPTSGWRKTASPSGALCVLPASACRELSEWPSACPTLRSLPQAHRVSSRRPLCLSSVARSVRPRPTLRRITSGAHPYVLFATRHDSGLRWYGFRSYVLFATTRLLTLCGTLERGPFELSEDEGGLFHDHHGDVIGRLD